MILRCFLIFSTQLMFYNHNTNLNKWFVSPYLTLYQRYKDLFSSEKQSQEDGHDNEVNYIEKEIISKILKSSAVENKMS